jgi:hypothetical protein
VHGGTHEGVFLVDAVFFFYLTTDHVCVALPSVDA